VLRGIFSGHVGTKDVTRLALEAEERTDYYTAQQLYKEVNNFIVLLFLINGHRHWGKMIGKI